MKFNLLRKGFAFALSLTLAFNSSAFSDNLGERLFNIEKPSVSAAASDFEIDSNGKLTRYSGKDSHVIIPNNVIEIESLTFSYSSTITSVTIPDSVKTIGESAFASCWELREISIGSGVSYIQSEAFAYCKKLDTINISPNNQHYTAIDNVIFNKKQTELVCYPAGKSDKSYAVPEGIIYINDYSFAGAESLVDVMLPETVTEIEYYAFFTCENLKTINLPDSLKTIGDSAFKLCYGLQSINIPNSVTSIGMSAFYGCRSLFEITLSDSIKFVSYDLFDGCTALTSVTIPEGIASIYGVAFIECTSLTSVTIPNSVTRIDDDAFKGCHNLTIRGYDGSFAQLFAKNNGIPFSIIGKTSNYTITFDANGGFGPPPAQTKNHDEVLVLDTAIPTRYGFNFIGWSENQSSTTASYQPGGSYYANNTVILYAVWEEKTPDTYTIVYNANGGSGIPPYQIKFYNQSLTLSTIVPTRTNHTFLGWSENQSSTTASYQPGESYSNNASVTLYAIWQPNADEKEFSLYTDAYNFSNSRSSFGYQYGYKIPLERYQEVLGAIDGKSKYDRSGSWGGSCFGFSSTCGLFFTNIMNTNNYGGSTVYNIAKPSEPNHNVTKLLERFQLSQFLPSIQTQMNKNFRDPDIISKFIAAVENFQKTGKQPVMALVQGNGYGHAVMAYKVAYIGNEYRVSLYDNNYPGQERLLTISSDLKSWSYYGDYISTAYNARLYYLHSDLVGENMMNHLDSIKLYLTVSTNNVDIYNSKGIHIDNIPDADMVLTFDNQQHNDAAYYLPQDTYRIIPRSDIEAFENAQPFTVSISDGETYVLAENDSAFQAEITLGNAPIVNIDDAHGNFDISVTTTKEGFSEGNVNVFQKNENSFTIALSDDGSIPVFGDSVDFSSGGVSVDDYNAKTINFAFNTDGNSIARYNIDIPHTPHGTLTTDTDSEREGKKVTVTVLPGPGYKLKEGSLKVNNSEIIGYEFTMPNENVILTAVFVKDTAPPMMLETGTELSVTDTFATLMEIDSKAGIQWNSSNTDVADVDQNGIVTALKPGIAVITATSIDDPQITANITIEIYNFVGILGDLTNSNAPGIEDALIIFRHMAGIIQLTDRQIFFADVNQDDSVGVDDALGIFRKMAGIYFVGVKGNAVGDTVKS